MPAIEIRKRLLELGLNAAALAAAETDDLMPTWLRAAPERLWEVYWNSEAARRRMAASRSTSQWRPTI